MTCCLVEDELDFLGNFETVSLGFEGIGAGAGRGDIEDGLTKVIGSWLETTNKEIGGIEKGDGFVGDGETLTVENGDDDTDLLLTVGFGLERRDEEIGVLKRGRGGGKKGEAFVPNSDF